MDLLFNVIGAFSGFIFPAIFSFFWGKFFDRYVTDLYQELLRGEGPSLWTRTITRLAGIMWVLF